MAITHSSTIRNAFATAVRDAIDAGTGAGLIRLFAGATQVAQLTLNDPCGVVSGAVLTLDIDPQPEDTSADATGTVTSFQLLDSDLNTVITGTVTGTGGGGDLTMPSPSVVAGDPIPLTGFVYTAPL